MALLYLLYLVVMGGVSLALFQLFLQQAFHPDFPAWLIVAAMAGAAGLWGLPRAGGRGPVRRVRAGAAGAGHGPGVWGGGPALSAGEPDAPLPGAAPGAAKGAALFLGRTTLFADMAVLLPFACTDCP